MIGRKNIGRASPLILLLLALGFFFATYNLLTMVLHNKAMGSREGAVDGLDLFDPIIRRPEEAKGEGTSNLRYHVALTATDAPYSKWQCRIMYYWYKKVKDMPGSDMGGFTRVLHSGRPDNLMEEIPTIVVDPLPEGLDQQQMLQEFEMMDIELMSYFLGIEVKQMDKRIFISQEGCARDVIKRFKMENCNPVASLVGRM